MIGGRSPSLLQILWLHLHLAEGIRSHDRRPRNKTSSRPCLDSIQIPSFFTLSPLHQFSWKSRDESFEPSWSTIGQYLSNKTKMVLFIGLKFFRNLNEASISFLLFIVFSHQPSWRFDNAIEDALIVDSSTLFSLLSFNEKHVQMFVVDTFRKCICCSVHYLRGQQLMNYDSMFNLVQ